MSVARQTVERSIALRRELHSHPEVGLRLPGTVALVEAALAPLGLDYFRGERSDSFAAVMRAPLPSDGGRRAVLIRADADALPIREQTGLAYASSIEAMHACGHDLHTAALVGTALELAARRDELRGDVVLLFQTGEEACDGAAILIEDGVLDAPTVDYQAALALHVRSNILPSGVFASRPGAVTGSGTSIRVEFRGLGGHGAAPHETRDPIPALVGALTAIPTALSRGISAFDPVVFTPGYVHAGNRRNIIPDTAVFDATLRTVDDRVRDRAIAIIRRVVAGVAESVGVDVEVSVKLGYPSVVTAENEHRIVAELVEDLFGPASFSAMAHADMMTEDFARVAQRIPAAFLFLGACPPEADPFAAASNHSSGAVFDDSVLARAIEFETEWAIRRLASSAPPTDRDEPGGREREDGRHG